MIQSFQNWQKQDDTNLSAAFYNYKVDIHSNIELVLRMVSSTADTIQSEEVGKIFQ